MRRPDLLDLSAVQTGHFIAIIRHGSKIMKLDDLSNSVDDEYDSFEQALAHDNHGFLLFGISYVIYERV